MENEDEEPINCFIYRLTSPEGKSYIGQTLLRPERRWKTHRNVSYDEEMKSPLYTAIRKFGWENFNKIVIYECDGSELDFWETECIEEENTLVPNGYNVQTGGHGCYNNFRSCRKHTDYDLPVGVAEVNLPDRNEFGFKVYVTENTRDFTAMGETMEEKYCKAMRCYGKHIRGKEYIDETYHKKQKDRYKDLGIVIPAGVKRRNDKGDHAFAVHTTIEGIKYRKEFTQKAFTAQENATSAIKYLDWLNLSAANRAIHNINKQKKGRKRNNQIG